MTFELDTTSFHRPFDHYSRQGPKPLARWAANANLPPGHVEGVGRRYSQEVKVKVQVAATALRSTEGNPPRIVSVATHRQNSRTPGAFFCALDPLSRPAPLLTRLAHMATIATELDVRAWPNSLRPALVLVEAARDPSCRPSHLASRIGATRCA